MSGHEAEASSATAAQQWLFDTMGMSPANRGDSFSVSRCLLACLISVCHSSDLTGTGPAGTGTG
jgi:hypothetical protein